MAALTGGWDAHVHVFDPAAPTRAGHYQPGAASLATIEALARAHGLEHLVLVQPSVYGTDHAVMLRALRESGGRHRGVAVLDSSVTEGELDALHSAGVRGVRFNLVSPVGNDESALTALAPRLRERGWHVQWYAHAHQLDRIARWQAATGLCFVLDHFAGLPVDLDAADPAWQALRQLGEAGAWVKLSAPYRLPPAPGMKEAPDTRARPAALADHARAVAAAVQGRVVWGSDWPHTAFSAGQMPTYASQLEHLAGLDAPARPGLLYA